VIHVRPQPGGVVAEAPPEAREPVRILFMDHTPIIGGAQLALAHHLRALDRTRYHAVVACTDAVPSLLDLYRAAGAEVHVVALPRLRRFDPRVPLRLGRAAFALRALVRTLQIDLVVANTSRAAYTATVALLSTRVPLVWWARDFLFNRLVFRTFRGAAARIICVSDAIRHYYGGDGDPRFAVVYVGSGMDDDLQRLRPATVQAERQRWGYGTDDIVIGFMGRLVEEKGAEDLITAATMLHERDARVKLMLVGTGKGQESDVEGRLRALVAERGLSFVTFAGFQSAEATYYSLFDVFVLSSRAAEAYPTSVVQAMLAGTPVVATATGGTAEIVRDRETGILVPPSSPARMAQGIAELVADPELRRTLTDTARAYVLRNNREEVTTRQAERCYEAVVAARRG
jgi:glycosyltransferase involved in cell wall biosynthesis